MDKLEFIKTKLKDQASTIRSLLRILESKIFLQTYRLCSIEEQTSVCCIVDNLDRNALLDWIKTAGYREYGEMSTTELRKIGRRLGILNYSRLTKAALISAIQEAELLDAGSFPGEC